jgi:hypothetical protein
MFEGKVLDGRNRVRALTIAGMAITPDMTRRFEGTHAEAKAFVDSANLHRRHLTVAQRALLADEAAVAPRGGDRRSDQTENSQFDRSRSDQTTNLAFDRSPTVEKAAEAHGVSAHSVYALRRARKKAVPRVIDAIRQGTVKSVAQAVEIAKKRPEAQHEDLARLALGQRQRNRDPDAPKRPGQHKQTLAFVGSTEITVEVIKQFLKSALDSERREVAISAFNAILSEAERLRVDEAVGAWARAFTDANER